MLYNREMSANNDYDEHYNILSHDVMSCLRLIRIEIEKLKEINHEDAIIILEYKIECFKKFTEKYEKELQELKRKKN
jgi:hypothetical protein